MLTVAKNIANISKKINYAPVAGFAKDLSFSVEARNKMLAGCDKLADAV